jgi:hypothetical protein
MEYLLLHEILQENVYMANQEIMQSSFYDCDLLDPAQMLTCLVDL